MELLRKRSRKGCTGRCRGVLKRTADAAVKYGKDVSNLTDFVKILESRIKNIIIIPVTEQNIIEKEKKIPKNATPFRGTLSVHQVIWKKDQDYITFMDLSCFSCEAGEICRHGFHSGFMKNPGKITDNLPVSQDFVAPLVRSKKNLSAKRTNISASTEDVAEDAVPKKRPMITVLENVLLVSAKDNTNNLKSQTRPIPPTSKGTDRSERNKENLLDVEDLVSPNIVLKKPNCC